MSNKRSEQLIKIRIIKDMSAENNSTVKIDKFIGKIFEAKILRDGKADVNFGEELGELFVYEGEYEVIESWQI